MLTVPLEAAGVDLVDVVGAMVDAGVGASVVREPWRYRGAWDLDDAGVVALDDTAFAYGSLERISGSIRRNTSRSSEATSAIRARRTAIIEIDFIVRACICSDLLSQDKTS